MDNKNAAPVAGLSFGYILRMQDAIADQLDHFKYCWEQSYGASTEGKVPIIFLSDRYTVFAGEYTPEEIKDAIERIHAGRKEKADKKLVGETVLNDAHAQPGTIQSEKLGNAVTNSIAEERNRRLADDMLEAVLDAVRNSNLFESMRDELSAQAVSINSLTVAVNDAIRNALQPGGLLYGKR